MKIPIEDALESIQMIVPEIDLEVKNENGQIKLLTVPMNFWNLYLNAIENASDLLLEELAKLPDLAFVHEIEEIASDINSIISIFNLFYMFTMEEANKKEQKQIQGSEEMLQRISKYRRTIRRHPKKT